MVGLDGRGIDFCLNIRRRPGLAVSDARLGRSCPRAVFKAGMKSICGNESSSRSGKNEAFMVGLQPALVDVSPKKDTWLAMDRKSRSVRFRSCAREV